VTVAAAGDEPAIRIGQPVGDEQGRLLRELVSPPGWPRLPPPKRGEKLAAYLERALLKDSFYLDVSRYFEEPRITPFRPALMTLAKWCERYPPKPIRRGYSDRLASRTYYPNMVRDRLLVALCDQLRAGEVELRGVRLSSLAVERVPLALFRFEDIVLYPNTSDGGQLRPEGRLPEGLPEYRELTLWPGAGAPVAASGEVSPDQAAEISSKPEEEVLQWLRDYKPRQPRETYSDWEKRRLADAKAKFGDHVRQAKLRELYRRRP
jgi:hypothetical protein